MQAAGGPIRSGDRRPRSRRRPAASSAAAVRVTVPSTRHDEVLVVPCPGRVLGTAALCGTARQCRRAPSCHAPPCRASSCSCPCHAVRPVWPPIHRRRVGLPAPAPGAPFLVEKQWRNERERPLDAVALTCYLPVVGPDETIIDSDDFGVCFSATKP